MITTKQIELFFRKLNKELLEFDGLQFKTRLIESICSELDSIKGKVDEQSYKRITNILSVIDRGYRNFPIDHSRLNISTAKSVLQNYKPTNIYSGIAKMIDLVWESITITIDKECPECQEEFVVVLLEPESRKTYLSCDQCPWNSERKIITHALPPTTEELSRDGFIK